MGAFNQAVGLTKDPAAVQEEAAKNQLTASQEANRQQQANWEQIQTNQQPWLKAGTGAINMLNAGLQPGGKFASTPGFQFDPSKVVMDPGYQFRLQQGVDARTAAGAAGGSLGSGNLGVALTNYGQELGSQEFQAAYGRQFDQYNSFLNAQNTDYNRLAGISGTGQVSANQLAGYGTTNASTQGQNLLQASLMAGNFRTNAANSQQNLLTGAGNQLGAIGGQLANYYTNQNAMNNTRGYNVLGDTYGASGYSDGSTGVTGGGYAGQDLYAGDLY